MKNWKQKQRIAWFLVVFLVAYMIAETSMLLIHYRNKTVYNREYENACQKEADTMTDLFGNALYSSVQNANSVFSQTWYSHLRNYVGFYEEEFDAATRNDIKESIVHMVSAMQYTQDLLILVPETQLIISKNGWLTPETYNRVFGSVQVSIQANGEKEITVTGRTPYLLVADNNTRKYPGCAVIVLNAEKLKRQFLALVDENVVYAKVTTNNGTVFENGTLSGDLLMKTASFKGLELTVTIGCNRVDISAEHVSFLLLSLVLLMGFALIGVILYNRMMQPVQTLVAQSGGGKEEMQAPFDYITSYIDNLKQVQAQLTSENQDKISEMNILSAHARTAMLYGLLTLRSFRLDPANAILIFPWLYTVRDMCLLALAVGNGDAATPIEEIRVLDGMSYAVQTPANNGSFALVWLSNDLTTEEKQEYALMLRREWGRRNSALCFLSPVFSEFDRIGEMGNLLERTMLEGTRIGSALSEDERARLLGCIHASEAEETAKLIERLQTNYDPSDVYAALCAVNEEKPDAENVSWETVTAKAEELLTRERQTETSPLSEDARRYLDFIDANLCDPDMSIIKLADTFGRHRTLISKEIKQYTGETFTDYLRTRRIELAMKRITQTNENIMQIANEVGYVSYSTFKRTFKQLTGKTPIEFRGGTEEDDR